MGRYAIREACGHSRGGQDRGLESGLELAEFEVRAWVRVILEVVVEGVRAMVGMVIIGVRSRVRAGMAGLG